MSETLVAVQEHAVESKPAKIQLRYVLLVIASSIVLGLPLLLYGPLTDGHDTHEHLNYIKNFSEQFWQGDLYPRWLMGMNKGLGSPSYFVFPPLPAYAVSILQPIGRWLHFNAFNVVAFLALALSGIAAFLWLQTFANQRIAAICAVLYMLAPYHLTINFYRRFALPETWAFVWMPLVLYFTRGMIAKKRHAAVGLAIAFALMIFSHLISVAMFFPIPICLALILSADGGRVKSAVRVVAAMALGTGLSAVYLISGVENAKYIPASKIVQVYKWSENLVAFHGKFVDAGGAQFVRMITWSVVGLVIVGVICVLASLKWGESSSRMRLYFWTFVGACAVFMMTHYSSPAWRHVHQLSEAVQFPWRFNGVLCLAVIWLIAKFFSDLPRMPRVAGGVLSLGLAVIFAVWIFSYGTVWHWYKVDTWRTPTDEKHLISDSDGWLAAWLPEGTVQSSSLAASLGPKASFKDGEGSAEVLSWKPRQIDIVTDRTTGGWMMVDQFYYPAWKATAVSGVNPLPLRTALPQGLVEVQVPPGRQEISLQIPVSFAEHLGRWISALSVALCLLLIIVPRGPTAKK